MATCPIGSGASGFCPAGVYCGVKTHATGTACYCEPNCFAIGKPRTCVIDSDCVSCEGSQCNGLPYCNNATNQCDWTPYVCDPFGGMLTYCLYANPNLPPLALCFFNTTDQFVTNAPTVALPTSSPAPEPIITTNNGHIGKISFSLLIIVIAFVMF